MFFHPSSPSRTRTQFLLIIAAATATAAATLFFYSTHQAAAKNNKKKREQEQEQERQKNPIYQAKEYVKKRTAEFISTNTLIQEYMKKRTAEIISNNSLIQVSKPTSPTANYHHTQIQDQTKNRTIDPIFYDIDAYRQSLEDPKNDHEKQWRSRVLVEYTPLGNIIMNYDVYRAGFAYYSDNNSLNYDLLNAVAMKYVKIFHCLDFFMDETFYDSPLFDVFYTEKKEDDNAAANKATDDNTNTIDSNDDVFLKKPQPQSDPKKQHRKTQHKKRVNKFVKKGKTENFSFLVKPPKRPVFSVNKDDDDDTFMQNLISYADYKNRQKKLPPVAEEKVEDEDEDEDDEDYIPNIIDI
jgi:hypothetical protein